MTEEPKKSVASTDCTLSNDIVVLYNSANVRNVNESVTVLFHGFLLESGFIPKDVSDKDKYGSMPENWNTDKKFKIKYAHYCCPSFTCYMSCYLTGSRTSVIGTVCDVDCPEMVDFKVNINEYLKQKSNFSDVFEVFCNLDEFSRRFKDEFCLPLLNLLHETVGRHPLYGMPGLLDELKMYILQCLPVEGVMSMSAVNKNFNSLANSSSLWKYLYQRDFSKGSLECVDTASSEPNWKQIYKREYSEKKRRRNFNSLTRTRYERFPRYDLAPLFHVEPDYDTDIGIRFDPPLPSVYPYPPSFFPPSRYRFPRTLLL